LLRDYQQKSVCEVRRSASRNKTVVLQLPTGSGKTVIAGDIIKRALDKEKRVAFLVPYISLINQTWESFESQGIKHMGVVQSDHPLQDRSAPVQICSIDTLARRLIFPEVDLVVMDEAHRRSKFVQAWMKKGPHFIGLTATPWTKGMGKHWERLVIGATTQQLIDEGYLAPFRVFAPSAPDLEGIKMTAGDYNQKELGQRVNKTHLIASIVETWLEKSTGDKTLCFAVNRAHAAEIQRQFIEAGVNAGYIDAHTEMEERDEISRQFHAGEIKIVCNVNCLVAGVDWDVRNLILATPTKSEIKYVQMVGRALRTAEGKDYALILDHSDTTANLGFVTDIHHTQLDDGTEKAKTERKEKPLKPCPECGALKKAGPCPACGFKPDPQSHVAVEEGELQELTKGFKTTKAEADRYWRELCSYAKQKGFKWGWARHTLMDMTGHEPPTKYWPRQMVEPGEKVLNFIKHKNIRWAKRKQKDGGERGSLNSNDWPMSASAR
jgi:DNA repair protein RadD